METREETEARETKVVDDAKTFLQGLVRKVTGINITNPIAGLNVLPTTEESLDRDSLNVYKQVNKPIKQAEGVAQQGLQTVTGIYGAALGAYGTVANQPRNIINITPPNQQTNLPSPIQTAQSRLKLNADQVAILNNLNLKLDSSSDNIERFMSNTYIRDVRSNMNKYGMGDGVFRLEAYDRAKGAYTNNVNRYFLERFLSPDRLRGSFSGFKKANKGSFEYKWAEFLESKGMDPEANIQAHHINALYDSIHLYDGIKFNSTEYWDLTATLLSRNVRPGITQFKDKGNVVMTMGMATDPTTPHGLAHKFYNKFTPEFFSPKEMEKIREKPGYRIQKAEQWVTLVNRSEDILLEAHRVWSQLNPKINISFEELVEHMSNYDNMGYNKLLSSQFQVPEAKFIKDLVFTIQLEDLINPLKLPPKAEKALRIAIELSLIHI